MKFKKNKQTTNAAQETQIKGIHAGVVNDSIITTETVRLALERMDEAKTGVRIEHIEELPFPRLAMQYLEKYRLDLIIIDAIMTQQKPLLYVKRFKNYDKDVKVIVLAKFITPEIQRMYDECYIDEYITLPFQDAHLWSSIHKAFYETRIPKVDEYDASLEELEKEIFKDEYTLNTNLKLDRNVNVDIDMPLQTISLNTNKEVATQPVIDIEEDINLEESLPGGLSNLTMAEKVLTSASQKIGPTPIPLNTAGHIKDTIFDFSEDDVEEDNVTNVENNDNYNNDYSYDNEYHNDNSNDGSNDDEEDMVFDLTSDIPTVEETHGSKNEPTYKTNSVTAEVEEDISLILNNATASLQQLEVENDVSINKEDSISVIENTTNSFNRINDVGNRDNIDNRDDEYGDEDEDDDMDFDLGNATLTRNTPMLNDRYYTNNTSSYNDDASNERQAPVNVFEYTKRLREKRLKEKE